MTKEKKKGREINTLEPDEDGEEEVEEPTGGEVGKPKSIFKTTYINNKRRERKK